MRLLNRSAGRISRHRRGPVAGLAVLLLGLLMTGGLYTVFAPAQAAAGPERHRARRGGPQALPRRLRVLPRPERRGHLHGPRRLRQGPHARRRRRRRGRLPGRHRPDAAGPAGSAGPAQEGRLQRGGDRPRSRRTSPRWPPVRRFPSEADYSIDGLSEDEREEAIVRGGQIFLTNCTACHNFNGSGGAMPRGGYAPSLHGVEGKYIYEALLTGPQAMPNFSNGNLSPEEKRDVIAYLDSIRGHPRVRRLRTRRPRPRLRGPVRVGPRHRRPRRVRRLDRRAHHPQHQAADQGRGRGMSEPGNDDAIGSTEHGHAGDPGGAARQPRSARRTSGVPPTSTRAPRSAPSVRSPASSSSRWCARSCSSSPTSPSRSATTSTPSSVSAPPPSLSA